MDVGLDVERPEGREVILSAASVPVAQVTAEPVAEAVTVADKEAAGVGRMLSNSVVIGVLRKKSCALRANFISRQFCLGCGGCGAKRSDEKYLE